MFACVCWTPFQILNAINYKVTFAPNEEMDLFICQKFFQADEIAGNLSKLEYVHKVYLVKNLDYDSLSGIKRRITILKDLLKIKQVVENCILEDVQLDKLNYSVVLSSGYLNFNILFNNYFNRRGVKSFFGRRY